jgi:hypothetical protein
MEVQMEHLFIQDLNQLGLLLKVLSTTESWDIKDNKRNPYNTCDNWIKSQSKFF